MKFLMTYESSTQAPPTAEQMAAIGKFTAEMIQAGVVVMTGGLQRPSKATHLKVASGKLTVTDGPFAETKELIDGFALIEVANREEAVKMAERFMQVAGDGEGEILQVYEFGR